MSIRFQKPTFELHPEGRYNFCIRRAELVPAEKNQYGNPRIEWTLESQDTKADGDRYEVKYWTGLAVGEKTSLGVLIMACDGEIPDNPEECDSDELIGKVFSAMVIHEEGKAGKRHKLTALGQKVKTRPASPDRDPFADE